MLVRVVRNVFLYYGDMENSGASGVPERILRDTRAQVFKNPIKPGTVPGKAGIMESPVLLAFSRSFNNIFSPDAPSTSVSSSSNGDELIFCLVEGRTLCLCHHV